MLLYTGIRLYGFTGYCARRALHVCIISTSCVAVTCMGRGREQRVRTATRPVRCIARGVAAANLDDRNSSYCVKTCG